ncbi:LOW QUALITY PROTEIN: vacuolar protein sorting-associated protein 13A [Osmerus eperlanus]|uniref:LOW QUALITY PROTEIN: vacuolar protein sorting-associated protein 13A n=1 Tax=Osmerus eperlanus TaxID=29151 RepID=UPI002E0E9312
MVFESVVVDVLNRFLGDYVVNLDSSQLKLGIWGGNAVLRNLEIKENALSQLDIPFKVRAGHIGRLELKIPWKNLYTQSVEATLDGVYLLIVPTASIKYDAEKEDKQLQEVRQRELQRIEDTKQKAAEQENPTLEKQDTFVEKLVTQVIKNLQVKISNIHVRYEDDVTNPNCPLSFGVSLQNLSLQTCDANWKPCLLNEKAKLFFKLVQLDNLFAYWNVNSTLYSNHSPDQALLCLQNSITAQCSLPGNHDFIFRPITANAKLRMNPRSDVDFSSPKVDLVVKLREVAIELNRPQYISILELLGSVDMMSRNLPYRKYRPRVHVHTNAFQWWQYVITGIMEVDVKPRLHMWSWKHIKRHRVTVKRYRERYKEKITSKKPPDTLLKELEEHEKTLDIFNITLARQQAEMEASKAGLRIYRPGLKMEEEESQSWFGWAWGWGGKGATQAQEVKTGGFDGLMTPAEKSKLYTAIGYSETAVNPNVPKNFEDMKVDFHMEKLSVSIKDSKDKDEIIKLTVEELKSLLTQRPGAQAIKLVARLSLFEVTGLSSNRVAPTLLSSRKAATVTGTPLLSILFETNPLDASADQRLKVQSQPLEIIYDAITVNGMSAFFMPPDDIQLDELTNATLMKLEQFRDRTATGLLYVIETQKVLDLNVNLMASYVIIPQTGFYSGTQNVVLLDLGHFKVTSQSRKGLPQLSVGSSTIDEFMSRAYDSFDVQLSSLQLLYSKPDGDWKNARKLKKSSLHILEPVDLKVVFSRAMVVSDPRMPKFKVSGELPRLSVRISDDKVRGVLALIDSIPLPESRPAPRGSASHSTPKAPKSYTPQLTPRKPAIADLRSSIIFDSGSEEDLFYDAPSSPIGDQPFFPDMPSPLQRSVSVKRRGLVKKDPQKNMTELLVRFEINEVSVQLCRLSGGVEVSVLQLDIEGLGTEFSLRTFDMTSYTFLREICLKSPEHMDSEEKMVHLITTLDNTEDDLLTLEYTKADKNGPEFKSNYNNTEQLIKVNFSSLDVHLHTEALLNAMNFLNSLLPPPSAEKGAGPEDLPTIPEEDEGEGDEEGKEKESTVPKKPSCKKSKFEDVVNLHIRADMNCLKVFIRGEKARIAEICIEGLLSEVLMRKKEMEVLAKLRNIVILDCDKEALYKKTVSIADKEVFDFHMLNHTDATEGDAYLDMMKVDASVTLTVGCIQIIFLNKFVSSILAFINNFQAAKEALAEVTVQAAEKATVGVMELAERSSRISLSVDFKAPVVFVPQSSSSPNVIVADLGMVTAKNRFTTVDERKHGTIPPVVDTLMVALSDLKLYRTTFERGVFQGEIQLLKPVNLDLSIRRNLASSWYHLIPDIEIKAHLKPMNLILSQDDLTVVLRTLSENLAETSDAVPPPPPRLPPPADRSDTTSTRGSQGSGANAPSSGTTVVTAAVVEHQKTIKLKSTLKLDFKFDSLTLVLYTPNGNEVQVLDSRHEQLKLAEVTLGTISTLVDMLSDGSMKACVKLTNCLLDDKRPRINMVTPRMMAMRPGTEKNVMVVVNYRAGRDGTTLDTLVQDVYLCASMDFLLTVADFFLKASQQGFSGPAATPRPSSTKHSSNNAGKEPVSSAPVVSKMDINVLVKNPEIVFVADLTRADAPALVMTTECELVMRSDPGGQLITASIKDLKVVACPFLREKRRNNVTTVLLPCQVFFRSSQPTGSPQAMEVSIQDLTLKVSPIIINTVITIQSVLSPAAETPQEEDSPAALALWEKQGWKEMNLWFLEDQCQEDAQSLAPLIPQGESLQVSISSICLTLEAGVGHRTVPMLLAKSSFCGDVKDWSTLINLHSQLNLEPLKDAVTSSHTGGAGEHFDQPYVLHLWPSFLLRNLLPYPHHLQTAQDSGDSASTLSEGHSAQLHTAVINQSSLELRLLDYLSQDWSAEYSLHSNQEEITFLVFRSLHMEEYHSGQDAEGEDRKRAELDIAVHVKYEAGQAVVAIHSPYWMVNKTGRLLQYKADDIHRKHPLDYDMPLLFSFKPHNFLQNNKVRLMISDSDLSDDFSLDTVGSYGDVKCKGRVKDYLVGVKIDASSFSLTRLVTFVPFYMLVNRTKLTILVSEEGQENWTEAKPEQFAIPFWPEKHAKKLKVKVDGSQSAHQTIDFTHPENCLLLHLDNTLGGIIVDVNLTEHSAVIRFSDYHDGAAPFLIINHTKDMTLEFYQSGRRDSSVWVAHDLLDLSFSEQEDETSSQKERDSLEPGRAVYYTWAEPTGSRQLKWTCGSYSGELKSEEDQRVDVNKEGNLFFISFYEGLQRVALFTQERRVYRQLCESEKAEMATQEVILSLQNVGVSLVNNSSSQEVSFIGITSSDVVWECKPKKKSRWKTLNVKDTEMLEKLFREYVESGPVDNLIQDLDNNFQVSLTPNGLDMRMLQPYDSPLRRNYLPGVKVEYSMSAHQSAYRVQINRIQIQNQLPGAIFPYVFYPVKLPKSVTMDSEPKPLTDISIITRAAGHSDISRIKYFKVLIQEMDLKLDLGFLYAILDLFTPENASVMTSEQEVELFEKDIEYLKTELNHVSATDTSPISLYEYFHISPIKLHLSFSLSSGGEDGNKEKRETEVIPVQSLNLLLKSIGATLTDVQDVVFKLAFFELTFQFRTHQQLQWEVIRHYSKQAIKQMYVLVLGLDVLGNPFGLIRGLSEGVEAFFYEPYQGAIQGPEEFVEGMALGVKALVGGAVGGIAGAASRITGAMAKGVAAITMDEEYQQKRREAMNKQPSGLREGLTRGGKGLVSGFVSGITGIVTKPIKGAQKEGAVGFFKGVGKGLVGAVARPTGGIIDMASSTFQGIKRAAETSQDVESLRPPRFIHEDGVIRPYKEIEGIGSQMLQKIENGRFARYRYFAHAKINDSDFLMITKRGVFFVTRGTFGQLTCEWQYLFDEFTKEPMIVEGRRLRIEAKERVKSVFHAKEFGKIINFKTPDIAKWVLCKLEDARESLPKY